MALEVDLLSALGDLLGQYQRRTRAWPGYLGDGNGNVTIAGKPNYVYVRMPDGTVLEVFNVKVNAANDLPVIVGYDPLNPSLLQVLTFRNTYANPNVPSLVGTHASTHAYPFGNDPVYVAARQMTPLLLSITGDLVLGFVASPVWTDTGWQTVTGTLDLSALVPVSGAVYILVYLDDDATLQTRTGAAIASRSEATVADIPGLLAGERPLLAVLLESGQTQLYDSADRSDLVDLRFTFPRADALAAEDDALLVGLIGW